MPCARLVPPVLVALALTATAPAGAWAQMPEGPLPGLDAEPPRVERSPPPDGGDRTGSPDGGDRTGSPDGGDRTGSPGDGDRSPSPGDSVDGPDAPAPTDPDEEGGPTQEGELPNTGSEPALLTLCGASLLLAGTGLRLRTSDVPAC